MKAFLSIAILTILISSNLGCVPEHNFPPVPHEGTTQGDRDPGIQPTWTSIYENLIVSSCLECHGDRDGRGPVDDIDLRSYAAMNDSFTWPPLISAGDPSQSSLYLSIADGSMPDKGPQVPADVVAVVRQWILDGARETELEAVGGTEIKD